MGSPVSSAPDSVFKTQLSDPLSNASFFFLSFLFVNTRSQFCAHFTDYLHTPESLREITKNVFIRLMNYISHRKKICGQSFFQREFLRCFLDCSVCATLVNVFP